MASTLTLQKIIDPLRTYPEIAPFTGASGFTREPALTIANDVMQRILAQTMDWKFNRAYVPTFITVPLQQDYVSSITDLSWVEQSFRLDVNNTSTPKPFFSMEAVRDLGITSAQAFPFNIAWLPNSLATMGVWKANTLYAPSFSSQGNTNAPVMQFIDANGNILYINSNSLNLGPYTTGGLNPSFPSSVYTYGPYGTSGNSQPLAAPSAAAGTTVVDNGVTWTVADPNGVAMRLSPLPPNGGLAWLINPIYQKKPPTLASLGSTIAPIPDEYAYLFRQGFLAMAYEHSPQPEARKKAGDAYLKWEEALMTALRSADRELEDNCFYPSSSIMGGSGGTLFPFAIGPAWPFQGGGY